MSSSLLILLFLTVGMVYCTSTLPDAFIGQWDLERSENFDEFLAEKGVNWVVRKLILLASVSKTFQKGDQADRYTYYSNSTKENVAYSNWALGEEFEGKGFDGQTHKITFEMPDANTLTEKHIRPNEPAVYYKYTLLEGQLVLTLEHNGVVARRFFKRVV